MDPQLLYVLDILLKTGIGSAVKFAGGKVSELSIFNKDQEQAAWEELAAEWKDDLAGQSGTKTAKTIRSFLALEFVQREMTKVRDNNLAEVNFDALSEELRQLFETEGAPAPDKAGMKLRRWWRKLERRVQPNTIRDHDTWRNKYLEALYEQHAFIEFSGLADARGIKNARMDSLFELPRLQSLDERKREPVKANAVLADAADAPRAIILGKPGAGKTTLLKCLAFSAAAHALGPSRAALPPELDWAKGLRHYLPVFYRIRALVKDQTAETSIWRCLYQHAKGAMQLDLPPGFFEREADSGGLLLMFDGLDEAGSPETRNELARRLEAFIGKLPDSCAVIVSSRPHDYSHEFPKLAHFDLCDLNEAEIESIIRKSGPIYAKDKAAATVQADTLVKAVKDEARDYLREMAGTALLLAMIVRVHFITGSLPGTRRDLYAKCVDTLLEHWSAELGAGPIDAATKEKFLSQLAYDLQREAGDQLSSREDHLRIGKKDLARRLTAFLQKECPSEANKVNDVIRRLHERDAILVYDTGAPNGEEAFRFVHRTFQEYFAGSYMATRLDADEFDDWVERNPPGWNETLYLAIASIGHIPTRERLLTGLLHKNRIEFALEAVKASRGVDQWLDSLTRFLARYYSDGSGPVAKEVADLCRNNQRAGKILDALFEPGNRDARSLASAVELVEALGGSERLTAFLAESKQYGLDTKKNMANCDGFWMDQYLVTNQDFERMIPGHKNARDKYSDQDNQPVIYVNWWEAKLYCRWRGADFHLPSDDQWYRAASFDPATGENREYPWRGAWDSAKANTSEAGPKRTTPVGVYPAGVSAYGCFDMAGNVWEWTSDSRRVRGGSWYDNRHNAACSNRVDGFAPVIRGNFLGFRCSRT